MDQPTEAPTEFAIIKTDTLIMGGVCQLIALAEDTETLDGIGRSLQSEMVSDHDKALLRAIFGAKKRLLMGE